MEATASYCLASGEYRAIRWDSEPWPWGSGSLSAVPEDAVAITPGDLAVDGEVAVPSPRQRGWLMRRLLLMADIAGLTTAFLLALMLSPAPIKGDAEYVTPLPALPSAALSA